MAAKRRNSAKIKKANGAKAAPRRVKSLQKFLKAYGRGSDAHKLREQFARRCGTVLPYLVHLGYGYRTASAEMAALIERHSHGLVPVEDIRPDIDWKTLRPAPTSAPATAQV